jgi:integrase/recombinase XerD
MAGEKKRPRLMTPDLEAFIERVHAKTAIAAERRARIDRLVRDVRDSEGGRAFERFVETRPATTTRRAYRQHLDDFVEWIAVHCNAIDPLDATPEDLAAYERDVDARVSERTQRRLALRSRQERVRTVRTAYQFCVDEGLVDRSPARLVKIRGRAEPKRTFLGDAGAVALVAACAGPRPSDLRDRSLITVLLHTGLRAAEAASLTWSALESGRPPKLSVEGKGRVVRSIPLSNAAIAALDEWATFSNARRDPSDPIWTRINHRVAGEASRSSGKGAWETTLEPLTPDSIHALVARRAAKAGLPGVTPHALRRTYATKLRSVGVSIDTISRYLGHASIVTTMAYFDPVDESASEAVRVLEYGT